MKAFFKTFLHAVGGAAASAAAAKAIAFVPSIPGIDPVTAAIIGSAISSVVSAHLPQPTQESK